MLLSDLEDFGINNEIWAYLTIRDIINISITSKELEQLCKRINNNIAHTIKIRNIESNNDENEIKILQRITLIFPNIKSLFFPLSRKRLTSNTSLYLETLYKSTRLCETLEELRISIPGCNYDQGILGLSKFKKITILDLTISSITNEGLKEVGFLIDLKTLDLSYNKNITDSGFLHLFRLTTISQLSLCCCFRLLDKSSGLNNVSKLTSLTSLDLDHTHISDSGASSLSNLVNLTFLSLSGSPSITSLSFISKLRKMSHLNISNCCSLFDEELVHLANLTNMRVLKMRNCNFDGKGFRFLSMLTNIDLLDLSNVDDFSDIGLSHLIYFRKMTLLILTRNKPNIMKITDDGLQSLSSLRNLMDLNLTRIQLTDVGFRQISELSKLVTLTLVECPITDKGVYWVSLLTNITALTISWGKDLTVYGLSNICQLNVLLYFEIYAECTFYHQPHIDVQLPQMLLDKLINLKHFSVVGCFRQESGLFGFNYIITQRRFLKIVDSNRYSY